MYYTFADTPAGRVLLVGDGEVIHAMYWTVFKRTPPVPDGWGENQAIFDSALQQIDEYFAGTRRSFDLPYETKGTAFQQSVWRELEQIPYGTTTSYQAIATAVGRPAAVRAVGTAVGSNPLSIIIPCHRVLTSAGAVGGYAGGIASKLLLLRREGIKVAGTHR